MIQFTRHAITHGLVIEKEHATADETLTFCYEDRQFTIGTEYYSLVITMHSDLPENPWRIEGLRGGTDSDEEIWYIGTMQACITEFERLTREIRVRGHQINEPDNYDFAKEIREYHKHLLARPAWRE